MQAFGNNVIVKLIEEEETFKAGDIILITDKKKEPVFRGRVESVGYGQTDNYGNRVPVRLAVGDVIGFAKTGMLEVEKGLFTVDERYILCVY